MSAAMESGLLSINVCDMPCIYSPTESDADDVTCRLPPLASIYSHGRYEIAETGELEVAFKGTGTAENMAMLSDGLNTVDYYDSTESGCTVQADAKDGKSFMLDAVRVFFNELQDRTPYTDGNLKLQGYSA